MGRDRPRVISCASSAANRFALVASAVVGFDSIAKVEPVVGNIRVRQVYNPDGRFTYDRLQLVIVGDVRVHHRQGIEDSDWRLGSRILHGITIDLDHVEFLPTLCPGVVGKDTEDRSVFCDWTGIKVWELISRLSRSNVPAPMVVGANSTNESKLSLLALLANGNYQELCGHQVDLNFDCNTGPAVVQLVQSGKSEEYMETHDYKLLSSLYSTSRVNGVIEGVVGNELHRYLTVRGSCDGHGHDELYMSVLDANLISGLVKLKKPKY